jgi:hypothetical protein
MHKILLCFFAALSAQGTPIDLGRAEQYFEEAKALSERDAGKLWKTRLYGPMLFADPETRTVVANQADAEGHLTKRGNVYVGKLPREENIANNATKWAGVEWTMVIWPLPEDRQDRARLMLHELFHRVQDEIGLPGLNPPNGHLDTRDGRIWLQMEWRALAMALMESGANRRRAVEDAMVFRSYRRSLFPQAASEERELEINEGLAEYTGAKLGTASSAELTLAAGCGLSQGRRRATFVRSFAYVSGPAYGQLLDLTGINWRQQLKASDDLGLLLQKALSIKSPAASQAAALARSKNYDGDSLIAAETQRERVRQEQIARNRSRFIERPILILPLGDGVQYSFNPNNVVTLDGVGTVYPTMRVSDAWGVLEVTDGALLVRDNGRVIRVQVPAPSGLDARPLKGEGWTLELKEGWKLAPGDRPGDFILKKTG